MLKRLFLAGLICVPFLISGCESLFSSDRPITAARVIANEDDALFTAVAIETDRRILIIDEQEGTVCGEPFTDRAEGLSSEFAEKMAKAIQKGKVDADAITRIAVMYDDAADNLSPVSQGIKYSRENLYALCISRQNSYISNADYLQLTREVINQSARLVALEIPTLRNSSAEEVKQMRDYLIVSMETSAELADAFSELVEKENADKEDSAD
jgi:hypothetical protein